MSIDGADIPDAEMERNMDRLEMYARYGYPSPAVVAHVIAGGRRTSHHYAPAQAEWEPSHREIL